MRNWLRNFVRRIWGDPATQSHLSTSSNRTPDLKQNIEHTGKSKAYPEVRHSDPWPVKIIGYRGRKVLYIEFDTGNHGEIKAECLRVLSPGANPTGHGTKPTTVTGKQDVTLTALVPVGHYAIRIIFDDGYSGGIYTWRYLFDLLHKHGTSQENSHTY